MQLPADATGSVATTTTVRTSTQTDYYRNYLPKENPYDVQRLVGYYEYGQSLLLLDALARDSTADEFEAIDEIVKSEPEFTIYVNLARRLERGRTSLVEAPERPGDDFSRRGIRWVTALARVELGAMAAGFTTHPQPFAAVAGPGYDAAEYRELLLDGAKMHFWSFDEDAQARQVFGGGRPNGRTLAYVRRLNIASAFIFAAAATSQFPPNSPQAAELVAYARKLGTARSMLQASIEQFLAEVTTRSKTDTSAASRIDLLEMCRKGVCRQLDDPTAKR